MPRRRSDIDSRREIIQAGLELFAKHGYDATPIDAILGKTSLSKGTFYHYFKSKEALLDAITEVVSVQATISIRAALAPKGIPPITKLDLFFKASRKFRLENVGLVRAVLKGLYSDENLVLRHKMNRLTCALASPLLREILLEGTAAGAFDVEDPEETSELILLMWIGTAERQAELLIEVADPTNRAEQFLKRVEAFLGAVERILELDHGSLRRPSMGLVARALDSQAV